jgi:hypothetical protein
VELVQHIEEFYKKLFGKEERGTVKLARSMWQEKRRLNTKQKERLIRDISQWRMFSMP